MKKRIFAALLAVLMVIPMALTILADAPQAKKIDHEKAVWESKEHRVEAMGDPVATSPDGNMLLYVDKTSGEMAIKNVKTGDIVLSNPYNISSSALLKREKPYALSQLDLNFTYNSTGSSTTFHSYSDSFAVDQAKVRVEGNAVIVDYMLGEQAKRLIIPNKISVADMETLLSEMTPNGNTSEYALETIKNNIRNLYSVYCSMDGAKTLVETYPGIDKGPRSWLGAPTADIVDICIKEYPICATIPIYVFVGGDGAGKVVESNLRDYSNFVDRTDVNNYDISKLEEYIDKAYEKVKEEGIDDFSTATNPKFEITAKYEITNTGLVASVDLESLKYDKTLYKVNTITLLPYFNAANAIRTEKISEEESITTCDKGYTFIPDGSGALVRFEDLFADNKKQVKFENDIYGNDYTFYQVKIKNAENMTMPVFGLANQTEKTGFLAVIEDGDAHGIIVSNHSVAYHSIYPTFKVTPSDTYDLADSFSGGSSSSKKIGVAADRSYTGTCKVNYTLLMDDEVAEKSGVEKHYSNTYVGMAKFYRDYLQEKNLISKIPDSLINKDFVTLFLEAFGSIQVEEKIATFPVTVNKELTTFDDVKFIHDELMASGVGNTSFILKGFANGGLSSYYPTKVKWQKVLGGKDGLNELLEYAAEKGFDVAPDVEFSYSYGSKAFSGFSNKKNGARTLDNRYTTKRTYYAATQTFERTGGVAVSSASFGYIYEKFYKAISEYDIKLLSVRSLGSDLNSDFDKEDYYDREASKDKVVEMLKLLSGSNGNKSYNLILDGGNSFAMPYASAVLSVSLDSSRRSEMSESVPFFGMVYHASVEFAGNAYNMEGDTEYAFLKAIENGATLYFTIAKQNVELLKFDPEYNKYYSVNYENLKTTIISTYKRFNKEMKDLQNKYIVDHGFVETATRVEDGGSVDSSQVVMVEYEGGIGFILNYSSYDINVTLPNGEVATISAFGYQRFTK
ncbi:MAG: hypothetical protein E7596_02400 [Ruminococcaceae bacterium]|nr:hypothetical protein [Oscillospiraceae bacterium]